VNSKRAKALNASGGSTATHHEAQDLKDSLI